MLKLGNKKDGMQLTLDVNKNSDTPELPYALVLECLHPDGHDMEMGIYLTHEDMADLMEAATKMLQSSLDKRKH
jgi:hypothetical protein